MLGFALLFFLVALAAAKVAFGAPALAHDALAQFIFYAAVALLVLSVMGHFMRRV